MKQPIAKDQTLRREAFVAAICGALLALSFLLFTPLEWLGEESYIATHVVLGHGYLNPYNDRADAKPTAMSPPVYPLMVAGVYKLFGVETRTSFGILYGVNVLSEALTAAGVYILAYWLFGRSAARWAVVTFMIYPGFGRNAASLWDTLPSLAGFIWILVWCQFLQRTQSATVWRIVNLGLALGVLALAHPTAVLTYPFLITMAVGKTTFGNWFKMSAIAFVVFLLALTPWTIRNYKVFGRIFPIRNNFNMELYMGNQPGTYGSHTMTGHPATDPVEAAMLDSEGENRYFDELGQRFHKIYISDPPAYWRHTLNRFVFLFVDSLPGHRFRAARIAIEAALALLSLSGVVMAWRLNYKCTWLFWICLLSVLPYIATEVALSYSLPLRAGLMVYAGFAVAALMSFLRKGRQGEAPYGNKFIANQGAASLPM